MANEYLDNLLKHGYAIIPDVLEPTYCEHLGRRLDEMKRDVGNNGVAMIKSARQLAMMNVHYSAPDCFMELVSHSLAQELGAFLVKDDIILSNFNASEAIRCNESERNYRIHIDSRKPNKSPEHTYQFVINWCIDDFDPESGSTVVVPDSHLTGIDPKGLEQEPFDILKTSASRGSAIVMLGQTWHDIGHNLNGKRRYGIIAYYSAWWIKPTYDFVNTCTAEIFDQLDLKQKELLGFNTKPPRDWTRRQYTKCDIEEMPTDFESAVAWDG